MKPTLFVLAAGMGSRYGGLKQLDQLGPSGETIMDYSIFDAIRSGFGKIVFVIRKDFENDFRNMVLNKYEGYIPVEVVFQEVHNLPEGFVCPTDRIRPWGTNHAVLMGKKVIKEPFCVINADDFYGLHCFQTMGKFLSELPAGSKNTYSMVGFRVANTLSENGKVSRGVCQIDENRYLTSVVERTEVLWIDNKICYKGDFDEWVTIDNNTPVSMNVWGFTPDYFDYSEEGFKKFLRDNIDKPKSEYFIPLMVNELISSETATVKVLDTTSKWFGVTYSADRQGVIDKIKNLVKDGVYPPKLF
ncbi:MAG TPA: nucleotidyltransferase [Bacteroidaceae bacterium]|nr:nucleotidyltransferase [Bacteroidaceae bacterium]